MFKFVIIFQAFNKMKFFYIVFAIFLLGLEATAQQSYSFQIALLKYRGGGDWYANLETSLPNLIKFTNLKLRTNIHPEQAIVEVGSPEIFKYPFVHMTGHGNVIFSPQEAENLRKYLLSGGFLHIDDNYGMDPFVRTEIKKVFPDKELVLLPPSHPIFNQTYQFPNGLPKTHEHDNKPPQAFGIIHDGRLICIYTYESDLGDGWESPSVHGNSDVTRQRALQMGANVLEYVLLQKEL